MIHILLSQAATAYSSHDTENYLKTLLFALQAAALTKTLMESMVGNVPTAGNDAPELITCQVPNAWFGKSQRRLYK